MACHIRNLLRREEEIWRKSCEQEKGKSDKRGISEVLGLSYVAVIYGLTAKF
ncbi:MAG: hypothetical protein QW134_09730 [Nitrososphaeria archaeon]